MLSEAVAATVVVPDTVLLFVGLVIDEVGAVVSGADPIVRPGSK